MIRVLILGLMVCAGSKSSAGDYQMRVTDEPSSCLSEASKTNPSSVSWPTHTPKDVATDVLSYFASGTVKIQMFRQFAGNGRIAYCGKYDPSPIYSALIQVCKSGPAKNKADLLAFLNIVDRKKLDQAIAAKLASGELSAAERVRVHTCIMAPSSL